MAVTEMFYLPYTPGKMMEMFVDDLALFVEELGLGRFHLFGHSLGGYVSLAFAEKYGDRLASLGLIHSTPLPDDETARANLFTADGPHVLQVLLEGAVHMGMMEAPEKMAEAIASFVQTNVNR